MTIDNISQFRDKCCYCFTDISEKLSVCTCNLSLCKRHVTEHMNVFNCKHFYNVQATKDENQNLKVHVEGCSNPEEIAEKITFILANGLQNGDDQGVICPHLSSDKILDKVIETDTEKCEECGLKENLWICLECGHIGCGRQQTGAKGKGHALQHHKDHSDQKQKIPQHENHSNFQDSKSMKATEKHAQAIYLTSIDTGKEQTYCYICNDFIANKYELKFKRKTKNSELFNSSNKSSSVNEEDSEMGDISTYIGITNNGQSCYVSSVMQLLADACSNIDLTLHFSICIEKPLDCFCCQLLRVIIGLQVNNKTQTEGCQKIEISDFLKIVYREMPEFVCYKQEDCSEFLQSLLFKISLYEDSMLMPTITSMFSFGVETNISCTDCKENTNTITEDKILYVKFAKKLTDAIINYFDRSELLCKCGGKQVVRLWMKTPPKKLLVVVKRHKHENNIISKITDPITVTNFLYNEINDISDDSSDKDRLFKVKNCICHQGNTIESGHYTWWVQDGKGSFLVNDEKVTKSDDKKLEEGVVYVFK